MCDENGTLPENKIKQVMNMRLHRGRCGLYGWAMTGRLSPWWFVSWALGRAAGGLRLSHTCRGDKVISVVTRLWAMCLTSWTALPLSPLLWSSNFLTICLFVCPVCFVLRWPCAVDGLTLCSRWVIRIQELCVCVSLKSFPNITFESVPMCHSWVKVNPKLVDGCLWRKNCEG